VSPDISRLGLSGAFSGTLAFPQPEMLRSGRRVALPHPGPRIKEFLDICAGCGNRARFHASKSLETPANPDAHVGLLYDSLSKKAFIFKV